MDELISVTVKNILSKTFLKNVTSIKVEQILYFKIVNILYYIWIIYIILDHSYSKADKSVVRILYDALVPFLFFSSTRITACSILEPAMLFFPFFISRLSVHRIKNKQEATGFASIAP